MILSNQFFRVIRLVALAVLVTITGSTGLCAQESPAEKEATGRLKGVVVDRQYARIPRSCLTIRNKAFQLKVLVDEEGTFDVELPTGTYEVIAVSPHFINQRRNNVRIEPGVTRTLNIMLEAAPEISGRCPAGTTRLGNLCASLCNLDSAPILAMRAGAESRRSDPQDSINEVCMQSALEQRSLVTEAEKNNFGVRRVEFFGLTYTRDRVVRARMTPLVNEGDGFSHERLVKSLRSMSRLSRVIYPLSMSDVILSLDRTENLVDMTICFKERRR